MELYGCGQPEVDRAGRGRARSVHADGRGAVPLQRLGQPAEPHLRCSACGFITPGCREGSREAHSWRQARRRKVGGNLPASAGRALQKVADSVTSHRAYGLGSYCYFHADPSVTAARAIEAPDNANVRFTSMVTVSLGGTGTISHVVNNTGGPSNSTTNVANLTNYP